MGLHTTYVGRVLVAPHLSADEVEHLRAFNRTRHWDSPDGPLRVSAHPVEDEPPVDDDSWSRVAPGLPGLWCPWTACAAGCCLQWDHVEKPYDGEAWLTWLIRTLLAPRRPLPGRVRHVCDGMFVGERHETGELYALAVASNRVTRRQLVPPRAGADEYGYGAPEDDLAERRQHLVRRARRFSAGLAAERAAP